MSVLSVWNRALGAANARGQISSLSENSPERDICAQWYDSVRRTVQSAAWWPGSKSVQRLGLVAQATGGDWTSVQPEPGYQYAYALPEGLLRPWHLVTYARFSLSVLDDKTALHTNDSRAILVYGVDQTATDKWTAMQDDATVKALAAAITQPLTGKNSLTKINYELANNLLMDARAAAHTDIGDETQRAVPWLAARGYYNKPFSDRYVYPYGELFPYAQ